MIEVRYVARDTDQERASAALHAAFRGSLLSAGVPASTVPVPAPGELFAYTLFPFALVAEAIRLHLAEYGLAVFAARDGAVIVETMVVPLGGEPALSDPDPESGTREVVRPLVAWGLNATIQLVDSAAPEDVLRALLGRWFGTEHGGSILELPPAAWQLDLDPEAPPVPVARQLVDEVAVDLILRPLRYPQHGGEV